MDCFNLERDGMAIDNHTPNNFHFATYNHVTGTFVQDATKVAYSDSLLVTISYLLLLLR